MATLREITYMVLDEIKATSDDSYFNEEHAQFLINKFRTLLLRQQYKDVKKEIPTSNYQHITFTLGAAGGIAKYKTIQKIPVFMTIATPRIYLHNSYYVDEATYVSRDRMKYVGYNKWLEQSLYASVGPDGYMYFTSVINKNIMGGSISGIFENPAEAHLLSNDEDKDFLDCEYPLEEGLIPQVVELTVKELLGASYRPADSSNNASDDLANLATFLARNTKSELAKSLS